jgi:hypothetical protein
LENKLTLPTLNKNLISSFAGGADFEIAAPGLTQDVLQGNAEVRFCEKLCTPKPSLSSADKYVCGTPPIATMKSNSEFFLTEEKNLYGKEKIYDGMTEDMATLALDN